MSRPAGARSIAMMRACLVSDLAFCSDDADAGRFCGGNLAALRAIELFAAFGLDLGMVMASSEVYATSSAAPPQPCLGKHPAGQDLEASPWRPHVTHSNALFLHESQSFLSKIVAHWMAGQKPYLRFESLSLRYQISENRTASPGALENSTDSTEDSPRRIW